MLTFEWFLLLALDFENRIFFAFSYIQYSNIAARVVRQALKEGGKADAAKRDITGIKFMKWENGKPVGKL